MTKKECMEACQMAMSATDTANDKNTADSHNEAASHHRIAAEKAKKNLSSSTTTTIEVDSLIDGVDYNTTGVTETSSIDLYGTFSGNTTTTTFFTTTTQINGSLGIGAAHAGSAKVYVYGAGTTIPFLSLNNSSSSCIAAILKTSISSFPKNCFSSSFLKSILLLLFDIKLKSDFNFKLPANAQKQLASVNVGMTKLAKTTRETEGYMESLGRSAASSLRRYAGFTLFATIFFNFERFF